MLKKTLILLLLANIAILPNKQDNSLPFCDKDTWESFLKWSFNDIKTSLHPKSLNSREYYLFNKIKKSLHPEWIYVTNHPKNSRDSSMENYTINHSVALDGYFPITYPWHEPFSANYHMNGIAPCSLKSFSKNDLQELIDSPPVLLEPFRYDKEKCPIPMKTNKDLKFLHYYLLFRHPDSIKLTHSMPRFNAQGLLATMIRNSLKK